MRAFFITGAGDRNRTYDLRVTSALLYRLSYTGGTRIIQQLQRATQVLFGRSSTGRSLDQFDTLFMDADQTLLVQAADGFLEAVSYTHLTLPTTPYV